MNNMISRQDAIDAVRRLQTYKLSEGDDMLLVDKAEVQTELMMLTSAQSELENKILTIGYTGKEGRIYIGGRLFAVRELAQ